MFKRVDGLTVLQAIFDEKHSSQMCFDNQNKKAENLYPKGQKFDSSDQQQFHIPYTLVFGQAVEQRLWLVLFSGSKELNLNR
jgi:hypothetical protein